MSVAAAAGFPQNSGVLIPEIWSSKLQVKFYAATVFADICNTEHEAEIKDKGDKIIIRTIPDGTVRDYNKGQNLTYENLVAGTVELDINKGKYWGYLVNDVDKAQSDIKFMNEWSAEMSAKMKIAVDTDILANIYADVATGNSGATAGVKSASYNLGVSGTPFLATRANVLDLIVDAGSVLTEQNVPDENRWFVFPPRITNLIKLSDYKDVSMTGASTSCLTNGRLGVINGFTLYESNNIATSADGSGVTAWNCIFGHKSALTFASQITKVETLMNQNDFGQIVRGLNVYGYEAIQPKAFGLAYVAKG